jgi:hypothetical protein
MWKEAGTCLTRALNTKEGISSRSQRSRRRPFHTVSETKWHADMPHCLSVTTARCEAADSLHLCRQGSRNVSRKSKQAVYYAVATSAKPKTFAKVAGRP